jgi:hypothetical protein
VEDASRVFDYILTGFRHAVIAEILSPTLSSYFEKAAQIDGMLEK